MNWTVTYWSGGPATIDVEAPDLEELEHTLRYEHFVNTEDIIKIERAPQ